MPVLMSIDGIKGAGTIPRFEGWLLLSGFTWAGKRDVLRGSRHDGRGHMVAVTPQMSAVKVTRTGDFVTPEIWNLMLSTTKKQVDFAWLRTGGDGLIPYMTMKLNGALITSMGETSSYAEPEEMIAFTYEKVTLAMVNVGDSLKGPQDVVSYDMPQALRA